MHDYQEAVRTAEWTTLFDKVNEGKIWSPAFRDQREPDHPEVAIIHDAVLLSNPVVLGMERDGCLKLFTESTAYLDRGHELRRLTSEYAQPSEPTIAHYAKVAPLCGEWTDNFWHFLTECLPYVIELEHLGFVGIYLIPIGALFRDCLEFFGIPPARIIAKTADVVIVDEMFVANRSDGQRAMFPKLISAVRDAAARRVRRSEVARRLYIARRTRVVLNDKDVICILKEHGFEVVYMEDRSFSEQVELACQSDFICGPHGAGLAAAMFMPNNGRLLEFFAPTYVNPCMLGICEGLGHKYAMVVSRQYREETYSHGLDILVDLPSLRAAMFVLDGQAASAF